MKNKKDLIRQFIFVIIIGLAVVFFRGEYEWSLTFGSPAGTNLETVLRYLNLGLPILAIILGVGAFLYLRITGKSEKGSDWEKD